MPLHPSWFDIVARLICTVIAGLVIGFDRGERGRPAGLRTTLLVALAASLAMIQANLLMPSTGKTPDSFVVFDLMRLPLGILSGMGFIGGGAILRRDNMVLGVTTAATLWFMTVIGLCFGGGQIGLGFAGLAIGWVVLTGLRHLEQRIKHERHAALCVVTSASGPDEEQIRAMLAADLFTIRSCSLVTGEAVADRELNWQLEWRGEPRQTGVPAVVHALSHHPGVLKVAWQPQER